MSQEKTGRTMIGTMAPVIPQRPVQNTGPEQATIMPVPGQPARVPASSAPLATHPGPPTPPPRSTGAMTTPGVPGMTPPPFAAPQGPMTPPPFAAPQGPMTPPPFAAPATQPPVAAPTVGLGPRGSQVPGGQLAPAEPDIFLGQELCGYTIRRKLAEGGMGVVYEGIHSKIGRTGAIKVLKLEFCRSEDVVERFYQEARAVNSIRHENIVDIYDFGRDPYGRVFFVMEYLEGEPLSARIRRGAVPWSEAFPILDQTLRALKAAHDKGFVHRDLKPDNIWLKYVDGRIQVKLLDFGIAKLVGSESPKEKLTQTGSVIGTPHYMSPEQINGSRDIDRRTDIYAMGVITYEMFAGVTPFVGETLQAIMTGHLFKEPPRLADIPANLGVPPPIAEIVDRMLVKDAAGRYETVTDVLSDLYDVSRNQWPTNAETLNRVRPARTIIATGQPAASAPGKRKSRAGAIIGAVVVAGAAVAGIAIWKSQGEPTSPAAKPATSAPAVATQKPTEVKPVPLAPPVHDYPALRKEAQDTLRASLREAEPPVRVLGSDALGKIKDQPSVPALSELTEKDPDGDVRGHSGEALGAIGATAAAPLLTRLEAAAPPPLKVWYASALARLGDKGAAKRLLGYARSKDLAVSFKAGLTLADISAPGDTKAIAALKALAAHEAELPPLSGALLLTKLAALRDAASRKVLTSLLDSDNESVRLAAAEGLARLGDDAGKKVMADVLANPGSPNRLVAAVAQIPLGEYGGVELLTEKLASKDADAETKRLAARALGEIGQPKSLDALVPLAHDKDWTVRIAAAGAIVAIVGLDPVVLAQASVDWTKSALGSEDLAVRKAAAGVLSDIPAKDAVPLLAQAIADKNPEVRLAASRSAGKIKSADAAARVAAVVKDEKDPAVKEQQVRALGEIGAVGGAASHDTLAQLSTEPGRLGVFAAGSLIAVGDTAGNARLEAAVAAPQTDLRLAAVEAASSANNPIVVPTLKIGLGDRVFEVKFAAALGLVGFNAEKAATLPVLTAALDSRDAGVVGRAIAALTRLGETIKESARSPEQLLESSDPKQRLAAVPIVRAMPPATGVALLRRLIADPDHEVRIAGVEAIADLADKDKGEAIKLYKPLVSDPDPFVRFKASGQLSRLAPSLPKDSSPPAVAPPPQPPVKAAVDDSLPKVQGVRAELDKLADEAKVDADAVDALLADAASSTKGAPRDDAAIEHVKELATGLVEAASKLEASAARVEASARATSDAAGAAPSPEASKLIDEAKQRAQAVRDAATATRAKATAAAKKANEFVKEWTGDVELDITSARLGVDTGRFATAKASLDQATRRLRKTHRVDTRLDELYAKTLLGLAGEASDPAAKRKLLEQAQDWCKRYAKHAPSEGNACSADVTRQLSELGAP